jgi:hypothetical protein
MTITGQQSCVEVGTSFTVEAVYGKPGSILCEDILSPPDSVGGVGLDMSGAVYMDDIIAQFTYQAMLPGIATVELTRFGYRGVTASESFTTQIIEQCPEGTTLDPSDCACKCADGSVFNPQLDGCCEWSKIVNSDGFCGCPEGTEWDFVNEECTQVYDCSAARAALYERRSEIQDSIRNAWRINTNCVGHDDDPCRTCPEAILFVAAMEESVSEALSIYYETEQTLIEHGCMCSTCTSICSALDGVGSHYCYSDSPVILEWVNLFETEGTRAYCTCGAGIERGCDRQ